jgi:AcrR family transcriptional regulator
VTVSGSEGRRREDVAPSRILGAARRLISAGGLASASIGDIAAEAGVSKALVHYHFGDKETLLARLAGDLAHEIVTREAGSLDGADGSTAVDTLWEWLEGEIARGDIRVLGSISEAAESQVRAVAARASESRRRQSAATVERLFGLLGLAPRVPAELIAGPFLAFVDGLARECRAADGTAGDGTAGDGTAGDGTSDPRVSFDVFWLAMLSLAD